MKTETGSPRWLLLLWLVAMLFAGFMLGDRHGYKAGRAAGYRIGKLDGANAEIERQIAWFDSTNAALAAEIAARLAAKGGR